MPYEIHMTFLEKSYFPENSSYQRGNRTIPQVTAKFIIYHLLRLHCKPFAVNGVYFASKIITQKNTIMKKNVTTDLSRKAGLFAVYAAGLIILLLQIRSIFA